jgi:hypothetical protein
LEGATLLCGCNPRVESEKSGGGSVVSGEWVFYHEDSAAGICGHIGCGVRSDGTDRNEVRNTYSFSKAGRTLVGGEELET